MDPYSSLEDIGDSEKDDDQKPDMSADSANNDIDDTMEKIIGTMYFMRERKPKSERFSDRPMRSTRSSINYAQFGAEDNDDSPKQPVKKPKVSSGPIAAQKIITAIPGIPMEN